MTDPKKKILLLAVIVTGISLLVGLTIFLATTLNNSSTDNRSKAAPSTNPTLSFATAKTSGITGTFTVDLMMNTNNDPVNVAETVITFPKDKISFKSITYNTSLTTTNSSATDAQAGTINQNGQIPISLFTTTSVTGAGVKLATVTFDVINNTQANTVSIQYVDSSSNIYKADGLATQIFQSSAPISLTTGPSSTVTPTSTATTTPTITATITPPTNTPTVTITVTPTVTNTVTPTVTATATPTVTTTTTTTVTTTPTSTVTTSVSPTTTTGGTLTPTTTNTGGTVTPTPTGTLPNTGFKEDLPIYLSVGTLMLIAGVFMFKFKGRRS